MAGKNGIVLPSPYPYSGWPFCRLQMASETSLRLANSGRMPSVVGICMKLGVGISTTLGIPRNLYASCVVGINFLAFIPLMESVVPRNSGDYQEEDMRKHDMGKLPHNSAHLS